MAYWSVHVKYDCHHYSHIKFVLSSLPISSAFPEYKKYSKAAWLIKNPASSSPRSPLPSPALYWCVLPVKAFLLSSRLGGAKEKHFYCFFVKLICLSFSFNTLVAWDPLKRNVGYWFLFLFSAAYFNKYWKILKCCNVFQ